MNLRRDLSLVLAGAATLCQTAFSSELSVQLVTRGSTQIDHGNYTTAISILSTALKQNPCDLEARRLLSSAFIGAGREKEAIQQLESIVRVAPGDVRDMVMMAVAFYQAGDTKTSIACYKKALNQDPASGPAGIGLARALMSTGDLKAAAAVCNNALRLGQETQIRQQFVDLLSTIKMQSGIVHRQLNG
jgi:predicted Zn-dependent protease